MVQVALAVVLLVASGLMIRTFEALRRVDPGFSRAEQVATLRISIPEKQVAQPDRADPHGRGYSPEDRSSARCFRGGHGEHPAHGRQLEQSDLRGGSGRREGAIPPIRRYKFISPGYVAAMGSRLIAGREFTWNETYNRTPVALVSENMARELWHIRARPR